MRSGMRWRGGKQPLTESSAIPPMSWKVLPALPGFPSSDGRTSPEAPRSGSFQRRDGLDLDQASLVLIVEPFDLHEGHRGVVATEVLPIHLADRLALPAIIPLVQDVDRELHHVLKAPATAFHDGLEVLTDLAELGDDVPLADDLAPRVEGHLTGHEEEAARCDLEGMRLPSGCHQGRGVDRRFGHVRSRS